MDRFHRDLDTLAAVLQRELDGLPVDPLQVRRLVRRLRRRFPGIQGSLGLVARRFRLPAVAADETPDAQVA